MTFALKSVLFSTLKRHSCRNSSNVFTQISSSDDESRGKFADRISRTKYLLYVRDNSIIFGRCSKSTQNRVDITLRQPIDAKIAETSRRENAFDRDSELFLSSLGNGVASASNIEQKRKVSYVKSNPIKRDTVNLISEVEACSQIGLLDMERFSNFPLVNPKRNIFSHKESSDATSEVARSLDVDNSAPKPASKSKLPSITSILNKTMSAEKMLILSRWKAKKIRELGEEGFQKYTRERFAQGTELHVSVRNVLSGVPPQYVSISDSLHGYWQSLKPVFPHIREISLLESDVEHPVLRYWGQLDCVAKYRDVPCVIEWKTSEKQKPCIRDTYDYPLQVLAYTGALNFDPKQKIPNTQLQDGLIVVAYEDGSPAHVHLISQDLAQLYWKQWLQRLHTYYTMMMTKQ